MLHSFFIKSLCLASLAFACFSLSAEESEVSVHKISSLAELSDNQPEGTVFFFDIDDTLIDSPTMLGSKAWRKYLSASTKNDPDFNWHDIYTLFVARHLPVQTVEPLTADMIHALQSNGFEIYGLTSRERSKWYDTPTEDVDVLTVLQLESVGIDFSLGSPVQAFSPERSYPRPIVTPEFYQGVYFSDVDDKGDYLLKLYADATRFPAKVIFVDDKLSQVESVDKALQALGIEHECYWYTATEEKGLKFDPLYANVQLYFFYLTDGRTILNDEEAAGYAALNFTMSTQDYLDHLLILSRIKFQLELFNSLDN